MHPEGGPVGSTLNSDLWPFYFKKVIKGLTQILVADHPPWPKSQGCLPFSCFLLAQQKFLPV